MMGTGNAWAWHKRAKLALIDRSKILPLESLEKVGAFAPTGSIIDKCNIGLALISIWTLTEPVEQRWIELNYLNIGTG